MKKIAYQTPEVKVKALFMESLMQGSNGVIGTGAAEIGWGGVDPGDGTVDPEAKDGFKSNSVWDD
jgi:hypothetical protein